MDRRTALLALALATAPLPALAQAWPGGALVSVASTRASPPTGSFTVEREVTASGPARPQRTLKLKPSRALDTNNPPAVDIRAKADWSDDQGFRASPTKVSYKLRF